MAHPNGASGIILKSCGTLRYTSADNFGAAFFFRSKFSCIYVYGMSLTHRFSGNKSPNPHITDFKCPLKFCIPFYAKVLRCITDGTNS